MILYAFGDSITAGAELKRESLDCYPTLLADKLGCPVINYGKGGASNEYIFRSVVSTLLAKDLKNDFIVIGWSLRNRRDVYVNRFKYYDHIHMYKDLMHFMSESSINKLSDYEKDVVKSYYKLYDSDMDIAILTDLRNIVFLLEYLKSHNIRCVMFDAFYLEQNYEYECNETIALRSKLSSYPSWFYKGMVLETKKLNLPIGKFLHPLEEGHVMWTDYLYNYIKENNLLNRDDV